MEWDIFLVTSFKHLDPAIPAISCIPKFTSMWIIKLPFSLSQLRLCLTPAVKRGLDIVSRSWTIFIVSVLLLYLQSKIRLAAFIILHFTEAIGQNKDHDGGDPRGKARAWSGTHCKKGFHRLVLEVGKLCRGWPAGSPHCTESGRRLPWPWDAGWAGHVGKVCMEGEKMKSPSPSPTQHLSPLILVSPPPLFSFGGTYSFLFFPFFFFWATWLAGS